MRTVKTMTNAAVIMFAVAGVLFLASWVTGGDAKDSAHPELSENEMLIPCASCHQENSPDIYQQWFDSVHGIGMVKCYQCHGTFETFKVTPTVQDCDTCHAGMSGKDHTEDKLCWECHAPHLFKASK